MLKMVQAVDLKLFSKRGLMGYLIRSEIKEKLSKGIFKAYMYRLKTMHNMLYNTVQYVK